MSRAKVASRVAGVTFAIPPLLALIAVLAALGTLVSGCAFAGGDLSGGGC